MQGAESFHVSVNGAVQVTQVDLRDLVLSLKFELVFQAHHIFKELSKLESCLLR